MLTEIVEGGEQQRLEIFQRIKTELLGHAKAEEKEFYSVLQESEETAEDASHAIEEHQEVEELLQEMSQLEANDDDFVEKLGELKHATEHHIKDEENELFPKARKAIGDRAAEIGRRFQDSKAEILNQLQQQSGAVARGGGEDVSAMTRDELYERARALGIEGRSKMTKNELARAVRSRG
jgi:hemerythrin superfamily protein